MKRFVKMVSKGEPAPHIGHALQRLMTVVAAVGLAAGISGPAHAVNMIGNGGFETGDFTGWTQAGNTERTGVECPGSAFVPLGNCDAFLGPVGGNPDGGIYQDLNTQVGRFYDISFFFQSDGGTPSDFFVTFGTFTFGRLNPPANDYPKVGFVAAADSINTLLYFTFHNDSGFFRLDEVSVSPSVVPEPGSMVLLGLALAGFGIARHRKRS